MKNDLNWNDKLTDLELLDKAKEKLKNESNINFLIFWIDPLLNKLLKISFNFFILVNHMPIILNLSKFTYFKNIFI